MPTFLAWSVVHTTKQNRPPTDPSSPPYLPRFPRVYPVRVLIAQEELRHFVLAIAVRHPDLAYLSGHGRLLYVDTVLVILFYECRCVVPQARGVASAEQSTKA